MSKKIQANKNFLHNLVKEALDDASSISPEEETEIAEPDDVIDDENSDSIGLEVDFQLENLAENLLSGDMEAAKLPLESLAAGGAELEDVYFAVASIIQAAENSTYASGLSKIQEQTVHDTPEMEKIGAVADLMMLAQELSRQGLDDQANLVSRLASEVMNEAEEAVALEIYNRNIALVKSYRLTPNKMTLKPGRKPGDLSKGMFAPPQEAGMGNAPMLALRALPRIFKWARNLFRRAPKKGSARNSVKKRGGKYKNRKGRRRGFKRNPKPKTRRVGKPKWRTLKAWKQFAIATAVANLDDIITFVAALVEDAKANYQQIMLSTKYDGNQVLYALESFEGEDTETVEYMRIQQFFALLSRFDRDHINCKATEYEEKGNMSASDFACQNRVNKPEAYFLPETTENFLKVKDYSPERLLASPKLTGSQSSKYYKIYQRYKQEFEKGSTEDIVNNVLFVGNEQAKKAAVVAVKKKLHVSEYIAAMIVPLIQNKIDLPNTAKSSYDYDWDSIFSDELDFSGEKVNLLEEIEEYKEFFEVNYFQENLNRGDVDKEIHATRMHFAAFSASSQTMMFNKKGGYSTILSCVKDSGWGTYDPENREEYALQAEKVKMLITLVAGGVLDAKCLALLAKAKRAIKRKLRPDLGPEDILKGPWGVLIKVLPIAELSFYIFDPVNIYDRKMIIEPAMDDIKKIIEDEHEYWSGRKESEWTIRPTQLGKINSKIESMFDEIESEIYKSVDRFYDLTQTDESTCQQLKDKVEIRKAAWQQMTVFKNHFKVGLMKSLDDKGDRRGVGNVVINEFTITSDNWVYITESIPVIKTTILELHKQIAVPEVGFFTQAPMLTPDEMISILQDPMAAKEAKEAEEAAAADARKKRAAAASTDRGINMQRTKDLINLKMTGGIPESMHKTNFLKKYIKEQTTLSQTGNIKKDAVLLANPWILVKESHEGTMKDLAEKLLFTGNPNAGRYRSLLINMHKHFYLEMKDVSGEGISSRLKRSLKDLQSTLGLAYRITTDSEVKSPFDPEGDSELLHQKIDNRAIRSLISKGYEDFNSVARIRNKGATQAYKQSESGLIIDMDSETGINRGGYFAKKNEFGKILIADGLDGFSIKYPRVYNKPMFYVTSGQYGNMRVFDGFEESQNKINNLLNTRVKAGEKYKVIYNPDDIVLKSKKDEKVVETWAYATDEIVDLISSNGNPIQAGDKTSEHIIMNQQFDDGSIVSLLADLQDMKKLVLSYVTQQGRKKPGEIAAIGTKLGLESTWLSDIQQATQIIINTITIAEAVIQVVKGCQMTIKKYLNPEMVKLQKWGEETSKRKSEILTNIQTSISAIQPIFFLRKPVRRADVIKAQRWMGNYSDENELKNIIDNNFKEYLKVVSNISELNKVSKRFITGNIDVDQKKLNNLLTYLHQLSARHKLLVKNSFDFAALYDSIFHDNSAN